MGRDDIRGLVSGVLGNAEVASVLDAILESFHPAKQKRHKSRGENKEKAAFRLLNWCCRWGHPVACVFPKLDVGLLIQRRRIGVDPGARVADNQQT